MLKEKLLKNEMVYGTNIWLSDPAIAEIVGTLGYDFVWIDSEHAPTSLETILSYISILEAHGCNTLVRLEIDNYNYTKKILEMGPTGVIFPMINTKEEAEKAIASTYYPPKGNRGIGAQRAAKYGELDILSVSKNEDKIVRCIQLETVQAIENLKEIVQVEGIDCYIFGLCDLSFDIGEINNIMGEKELYYVKKAITILKAHKKSIGICTANLDMKFIKFWKDLGVNFISCGMDFEYIRQGAKKTLINLNNI